MELASESNMLRFLKTVNLVLCLLGNLYNLKVYASTPLSDYEQIVFNAGNHRELVKLSYKDFDNLVKPETAAFSIKES